MKIFEYKSYDDYKQAQIEANKKKLHWVYVQESTIKLICDYRTAKNVLCHGTRRGVEQQYFKKFIPDVYVVGTEISDTATQFEDTVEWDFHNQKNEWVGKFDIVYSNSLDHSYKPKECVDVWKEQLNKDGNLFIEWHRVNLKSNRWDPFSGTLEQWVDMLKPIDILENGEYKILVI